MSENEIGLREGRAQFGDLVNRAEYAGTVTYITRHGRRVAAIVPINLAPQEPAVTTFTRDNDNPDWGTDTITLTASGNEVGETFTVDGVNGTDISSFSSEFEVEDHLRDRRIYLKGEGYTEQ